MNRRKRVCVTALTAIGCVVQTSQADEHPNNQAAVKQTPAAQKFITQPSMRVTHQSSGEQNETPQPKDLEHAKLTPSRTSPDWTDPNDVHWLPNAQSQPTPRPRLSPRFDGPIQKTARRTMQSDRRESNQNVQRPASPMTLTSSSQAVQREDEERRLRIQLATQVSKANLAAATTSSSTLAPPSVEVLSPGWSAVEVRLTQHIQKCDDLVKRKAFYSALDEAHAAAIYLVQVIDSYVGGNQSLPAWKSAIQALQEADEFEGQTWNVSSSQAMAKLVGSHSTPVFRNEVSEALSPAVAAATYRLYAEEQLLAAAQEHPWAGEVFYAVGRVYQAHADTVPQTEAQLLRMKAVVFLKASHRTDPGNALPLNQLGFLLLQLDKPVEARKILIASYQLSPSVACLENLIETSRRLEDGPLYQWSIQNYANYKRSIGPAAPVPNVTLVDPKAFAATSGREQSGPSRPVRTAESTPQPILR